MDSNITSVGRSTPEVSFNKPGIISVNSAWFLDKGSTLEFVDTWARQSDGSFQLLMQNIHGDEYVLNYAC